MNWWNSPERLLTWITGAGLFGVALTLFAIFANLRREALLKIVDRERELNIAGANENAAIARLGAAQASEGASKANALAERARLQAAEAEERAKRYESEIAESKLRAAEALKVAEQERLERAKIEERLSDRTISQAQMETVANRLREFAGQKFHLITYWDSREPVALSVRLYQTLIKADWSFVKDTQYSLLPWAQQGVFVWMHPSADAHTKRAASSLKDALDSSGIESHIKQMAIDHKVIDEIRINVGTKP